LREWAVEETTKAGYGNKKKKDCSQRGNAFLDPTVPMDTDPIRLHITLVGNATDYTYLVTESEGTLVRSNFNLFIKVMKEYTPFSGEPSNLCVADLHAGSGILLWVIQGIPKAHKVPGPIPITVEREGCQNDSKEENLYESEMIGQHSFFRYGEAG